MGWRFRRSFKVIPGLRLNLTKTGLSASIGGAPFTLNVGPHGAMGTASAPGTGLSYRHHFNSQHVNPPATPSLVSPQSQTYPPGVPPSPVSLALPSSLRPVTFKPVEEVHSASTELLTSESLEEVKALLQTTLEERQDITRQLQTARSEKAHASQRYLSWENGFLFKRVFTQAFALRKTAFQEATEKVFELEEQLRLTTVATEVEIQKEQAQPYFHMRDRFAALCECGAIWDIKSHQGTNKFYERTIADTRVDRQRVTFALGNCDLIQWDKTVPHMQNAKGGDLYLFPGFILYRIAKEAFSTIDYHDVRGSITSVRFHETDKLPADSVVVGQTWAKANQDGRRDQRFANNYQIPIALYGTLTLRSDTGLWEEFQFSDLDLATRFLNAFNFFAASFGRQPTSHDI